MKNRYIIALVAVALVVASCNDFLDTTPDNRTELNTNEKLIGLMTSAYEIESPVMYFEMMGDDHDDIGTNYPGTSNSTLEQDQAWRWEPIMAGEGNSDSPAAAWSSLYKAIATANSVLKGIEDIGDPADLAPLKGEALMMRAFAHFELANIFCQRYSENPNPLEQDMGIPYVKEPATEINLDLPRGTIAEVYQNIDQDIQAGLPLIDDQLYSVPKYHFNRAASYAFAAEFYLSYRKTDSDGDGTPDTGNLDKVIEYASIVLGDNPKSMIRDVTPFVTMRQDVETMGRAYTEASVPTNLLLTTNHSNIGRIMGNWGEGKRYLHSEPISNLETLSSPSILWGGNSQGTAFIFPAHSYASVPTYWARLSVPRFIEYLDPVAQTGWVRSIAIEASADNALLNRAEAYILKGGTDNYELAMDDIYVWRSMRINPAYGDLTEYSAQQVADYYYGMNPYSHTAITPTKKKMSPEIPFIDSTQEGLIRAILHIRRIEFWGEGRRWLDIKRYGIEIIRREYRLPDTFTQVDVLPADDLRRAIQLPQNVIAAGVTPNPR